MFRQVHLRLTLLCAGITALIMIIMSLSYLYVSEQGLHRNQFLSFKSDMNTMITNLEQQSVISFEWLAKMEAQSNYMIFALDNDTPLLYNQVRDTWGLTDRNTLLEEGLAAYHSSFAVTAAEDTISTSPYTSYHMEYEFTSPSTGQDYYASVIRIERYDNILQLVIFYSLDRLTNQITEQRLGFVFIDVISIIALTLFAWIFTSKLLRPIEENRKQQVQFVASASHELRTPLSVILSCSSACKSADAEKTSRFLQTIESESIRMSGLIDDMLTLSRADNHTWNLQMSPLQPDTLLLNAYETFEPMAVEKDLSFHIDLPDIPLVYFSGDKARMEQVLSILIHNAISYTPAGGQITLSLRTTGRHVIFSVADNGPGIPDQEKSKIFRRFYRAEKSRSAKGHSGLGLSIAAEIIQAHHGTLQVKDAPDGGAIFEVRLVITAKTTSESKVSGN